MSIFSGSAIAGISDTELKRVRLILEITLANFPSGDFSVLVPIMFHILKMSENLSVDFSFCWFRFTDLLL